MMRVVHRQPFRLFAAFTPQPVPCIRSALIWNGWSTQGSRTYATKARRKGVNQLPSDASGSRPFNPPKSDPPPANPPAEPEMSLVDRQLEMMDRQDSKVSEMEEFQRAFPGMNLYKSKFPLLDLHIPEQITWEMDNPQEVWQRFKRNLQNVYWNGVSMYQLAAQRALPGIGSRRPLSLQIFKTTSLGRKAWIAPLRDIAQDLYIELNEAIASGDERALKRLTSGDYQSQLLSKVRRRQQTAEPKVLHWTYHGAVEPTRVLSIRASEAYPGPGQPPTGCGLIAQALVKFDSTQSLDVHSKRSVRTGEPRQVREFLVLERKMWAFDSPWTVRDQLFDDVEAEYQSVEDYQSKIEEEQKVDMEKRIKRRK